MSPRSVLPGERVELVVRLNVPAGLEGTELVSLLQIEETFLSESRVWNVLSQRQEYNEGQLELIYHLVTYRTGAVAVPPIGIRFGAESYSTERTPIEVRPTASSDRIDPVAEPVDVPLPWRGVGGLLLAAGAAFFAWSRWKARKREDGTHAGLSHRAWLEAQLVLVRALAEDYPDLAMDRLFYLLRAYILRRDKKPATAWTTREFAERAAVRVNLDVFEEWDRARFGGKGSRRGQGLLARALGVVGKMGRLR